MQIQKQIEEWYSKWFSGEEELSDEEEEALEELKTITTKSAEKSLKNWYFEDDELVITKGSWVIDRYKKHQPKE